MSPGIAWTLLRKESRSGFDAPLNGGPFRGVNVAGGSFSDHEDMSAHTYGSKWFYDVDGATRTDTSGLAFLRSQGVRIIRIDYRWERMQPTLGAALNSAEVGRMHAMLAACDATDLYAIVDCHNYGHRKTTEAISSQAGPTIGDTGGGGPSIAQWQDFYDRFSTEFRNEPALLGYELMNEPVQMTGGAAQSHTNDQAAVDAIRANDRDHYIFVDGYNWAAVGGWTNFNPTPWVNDSGRVDSAGKDLLRYVGHHYFDPTGENYTNRVTPQSGDATRVALELLAWGQWLEDNGVMGAITEVGWPDNNEWNQIGDDWFERADILGLDVTMWATGAAWSPSYMLRAFGAGISSNKDRQDWGAGDQIDITHGQGEVLLRTWAPTVDPPPAGLGAAMPRGPTGSRWGPDALGPDGGYPGGADHMDYNSAAGKAFTAFAQSADFYDSIGACCGVQSANGYTTIAAQTTNAIAALTECGIRHVRMGLYSPAITVNSALWTNPSNRWIESCRRHNTTRDTNSGGPDGLGEQPIYNVVGWSYERDWGYQHFQPQNGPEGFDTWPGTGEKYWRPLDGPPGVVTQSPASTVNKSGPPGHWAGKFHSRQSVETDSTPTSAQDPLGWETVASLAGPNEPGGGRNSPGQRPYWGALSDNPPRLNNPPEYGMREVSRQMLKLKRDPSRQTDELLDGEEYVDFSDGRIHTGAKFSQMPVAPWHHAMNASWPGWTDSDDYTQGANGEVGTTNPRKDADYCSIHLYWGGEAPRPYYRFGTRSAQSVGQYGEFHALSAVNGSMNPDSGAAAAPSGGQPYRRMWRSIPMWVTEWGYVTWGKGQTTHPGVPPDIYAEYILRQWVIQYLEGFKRQYIYSFSNQGTSDNNAFDSFGLVMRDWSQKRPPFYAIKNMLGLVKFAQGTTSTPISVPHTFTPGTDNIVEEYYLPVGHTGGTRVPDTIAKLVLQQSDNTYIIILVRTRQIYNRSSHHPPDANSNGNGWTTGIGQRKIWASSDRKSVKLTLPAGTWSCSIAEPAKNPAPGGAAVGNTTDTGSDTVYGAADWSPGSPWDGTEYLNPTDGQALEAPTAGTDPLAAAPWFTKNGNDLYVQMAGLTRVIKAVKTA